LVTAISLGEEQRNEVPDGKTPPPVFSKAKAFQIKDLEPRTSRDRKAPHIGIIFIRQ
jgi:hypothetical protein